MNEPSEFDQALNEFLRELTDLSHRYQIGIAEEPVLFIMEPEDRDIAYQCDAESRLTY